MPYSVDHIKNKLSEKLAASHVEVVDESDGCGDKFVVLVVSSSFAGKPLLQRHRLVNSILEEELKEIHAFSQKTLTPEEWEKQKVLPVILYAIYSLVFVKMISFKVSAPGKLILYGEHAVVYGRTALAGSLDLRTTLEFEELNSEHLNIYLLLPKISLSKNVPIKKVEDHFFNDIASKIDDNSDHFYKHVQDFVEGIGYANIAQKLALEAFFFLFISILKSGEIEMTPFRIHIDTMLSISSGLGSSASFAVCLTTCFVHYVHLRKKLPTTLNTVQLDEISKYALNCEKIMHGNPSGIDNAVCTYGSIVEFRKNDILQPITNAKSMRVLLVDTKVPRSTKALVEKVAKLRAKYPTVFEPILDSIDNVSREALNIVKGMKLLAKTDEAKLNDYYEELLVLIDVNQNLLASCQVSHPTLDDICTEAKKYSLRAKLTGAGGGGYAYVLLLPDTKDETITEISSIFLEKGYGVTLTNLGGPGVRIEN